MVLYKVEIAKLEDAVKADELFIRENKEIKLVHKLIKGKSGTYNSLKEIKQQIFIPIEKALRPLQRRRKVIYNSYPFLWLYSDNKKERSYGYRHSDDFLSYVYRTNYREDKPKIEDTFPKELPTKTSGHIIDRGYTFKERLTWWVIALINRDAGRHVVGNIEVESNLPQIIEV